MAALLLPALDHSTIQARLWAIVGAAVEAALGTRAPRPANDNCDDLLDAIAAGHLLGMTPSALRQAARRGTIRSVKLGRRVRFRRGDLLALGRER
jgi:excisionase family DNA binding protein